MAAKKRIGVREKAELLRQAKEKEQQLAHQAALSCAREEGVAQFLQQANEFRARVWQAPPVYQIEGKNSFEPGQNPLSRTLGCGVETPGEIIITPSLIRVLRADGEDTDQDDILLYGSSAAFARFLLAGEYLDLHP
jgi:hypothetical protein